jgi:hypothetical protein
MKVSILRASKSYLLSRTWRLHRLQLSSYIAVLRYPTTGLRTVYLSYQGESLNPRMVPCQILCPGLSSENSSRHAVSDFSQNQTDTDTDSCQSVRGKIMEVWSTILSMRVMVRIYLACKTNKQRQCIDGSVAFRWNKQKVNRL